MVRSGGGGWAGSRFANGTEATMRTVTAERWAELQGQYQERKDELATAVAALRALDESAGLVRTEAWENATITERSHAVEAWMAAHRDMMKAWEHLRQWDSMMLDYQPEPV
jgi:hypothetical protein